VDQEPGSDGFLTPGSGMAKNQDPDPDGEQPRSYFRELRNSFWVKKYLNSLMWIRDGKNSDPGWKKFGSRDPG
jgi:hypothetical protein